MVPLNLKNWGVSDCQGGAGRGLQFNSDRAGLEINKIDRIYRNFFAVNCINNLSNAIKIQFKNGCITQEYDFNELYGAVMTQTKLI